MLFVLCLSSIGVRVCVFLVFGSCDVFMNMCDFCLLSCCSGVLSVVIIDIFRISCFCLFCLIWFFFFVKQKTAYEFRISYWSSDVCSSDLLSFLAADTGRYGLPPRYALLVPGGAPHRPAKRWPAAAFAELANHLAGRGITPVLIGQRAEQQAIDAITDACPAAVSLLGQTSIAELATLARGAALAVGNDTGPMHTPAAAGCPPPVLYSAESDPRKETGSESARERVGQSG